MPSKTSWTERCWDTTGGCTKCRTGCQNCWAIKSVWRLAHNPNPKVYKRFDHLVDKVNGELNWTGKIKLFPEMLNVPLRRKKPTVFFVNSKSGLFHEAVPFEFIRKVLIIIYSTGKHNFIVLTKRPKRALEFWEWFKKNDRVNGKIYDLDLLTNLYLGISVSTQRDADELIPILLQIPAAHRVISFEPLLENIKFKAAWFPFNLKSVNRQIHQITIGCESGPHRRLCQYEWIEDLIKQCKSAGVSCFVKQIPFGRRVSHKPEEWPRWARQRELIWQR